MNARQAGFTLIEVLAALIIVSLGMLAVIQAVSQTVNNANYLREKTIAHWVAMNKLTETRLNTTPPAGGDSEGDVNMAGSSWRWRMKVSPTDVKTMSRIDVNVAPKDAGKDASIASISGFFGAAITNSPSILQWDPTAGAASSSSTSSSINGGG